MFTQLFNIEKFNHYCKGIILGDFLKIDKDAWLEELFFTFTPPTVGGFKITHAQEKITLPIGKMAKLENATLLC
jgi:muramoyltetrapeptide carboxypeptidase LdcA involved in peptidoglycan recycling